MIKWFQSLMLKLGLAKDDWFRQLVVEVDLAVDGSVTPVTKVVEGGFIFIERILFAMIWEIAGGGSAVSWIELGDLTADTTGIEFKHGEFILGKVTKNFDFKKFTYDTSLEVDTKGVNKNGLLSSRGSFNRFGFRGLGLPVFRNDRRLSVTIDKDLSSLTEFKMVAQGWTWDR